MKIELGQSYSFLQSGIRHTQEDARFPNEDLPSKNQRVFLVCDGVGGNSKGEVASRTVSDVLGVALSNRDWSKPLTEKDFALALGKAYSALEKVAVQARDMATTMALVAFHGSGVLAAHIGDSRIYQVRPGVGVMYRSDDHSLVNVMVHAGSLSPEEAETHPQRHFITRSMSCATAERDPAAVLQIIDVEAGDYFVVSTDGMLCEVSDDKLEEVLEMEITDSEKVDFLREMSKDSADNCSVIIIPVLKVEAEEDINTIATTKPLSRNITKEIARSNENEILQVNPKTGIWDKVKSILKK